MTGFDTNNPFRKDDALTSAIRDILSGKEPAAVEEATKVVDEDKAAYEKFFNAALKRFGVKSPADFDSEEKKKEFFDYIDKNYKASDESVKEENVCESCGKVHEGACSKDEEVNESKSKKEDVTINVDDEEDEDDDEDEDEDEDEDKENMKKKKDKISVNPEEPKSADVKETTARGETFRSILQRIQNT